MTDRRIIKNYQILQLWYQFQDCLINHQGSTKACFQPTEKVYPIKAGSTRLREIVSKHRLKQRTRSGRLTYLQ